MYKQESRKSHNTETFMVLLAEAWEHLESPLGQLVKPQFSGKHQVTLAFFIPGPVFVKGKERTKISPRFNQKMQMRSSFLQACESSLEKFPQRLDCGFCPLDLSVGSRELCVSAFLSCLGSQLGEQLSSVKGLPKNTSQ